MSALNSVDVNAAVEAVKRDGFVVLPGFLPVPLVDAWRDAFWPLLEARVAEVTASGEELPRGAHRHYVTLPFEGLWADTRVFDDDTILAIVDRLVGPDPVMCQLATDTPVKGSDFQDIHSDAPPLFPEWGRETPAFQLAVNFPLVDVSLENGPFEVARGTHMLSKETGLHDIDTERRPLIPVEMKRGDLMIRDVRALHRGTPNRTDTPRPMVVVGYSRRWLRRPEVSVTIPDATWEKLSPRAQRLLRFEPRVRTLADAPRGEVYKAFAY